MMRAFKRKTANDYVCPICFYRPNKCTCSCYSMSLILIDKKLQYAIQQLNHNNIFTVDCCEGHYEDRIPNTYISFVHEIKNPPKGFCLVNNKIIRHFYKAKTKKEFKKEQEEVIKNLNEWVDNQVKSRWEKS